MTDDAGDRSSCELIPWEAVHRSPLPCVQHPGTVTSPDKAYTSSRVFTPPRTRYPTMLEMTPSVHPADPRLDHRGHDVPAELRPRPLRNALALASRGSSVESGGCPSRTTTRASGASVDVALLIDAVECVGFGAEVSQTEPRPPSTGKPARPAGV